MEFFVSPTSKCNDGVITVIYTHGKPHRSELISSLLNQESGKYINKKSVNVEKVVAFCLEPMENSKALFCKKRNNLILNVSGEVVPYSKIFVEAHGSIITLLRPKHFKEDQWERMFVDSCGSLKK